MSIEGGKYHNYKNKEGYLYPEDHKPANDAKDAYSKRRYEVVDATSVPADAPVPEILKQQQQLHDAYDDESALEEPPVFTLPSISRRDFLGTAGVLAGGALATDLILKTGQHGEDVTLVKDSAFEKEIYGLSGKKAALAEQVHRQRERTVDLSELQGMHIGSMGAKFLGMQLEPERDVLGMPVKNKDGTIAYKPLEAEQHEVRWDKNIYALWHEKNAKYPSPENQHLARHLTESEGILLQEGKEQKMSLNEFIAACDADVRATRSAIDWEKVGILYGFENVSGAKVAHENDAEEKKAQEKKGRECLDTLKSLAERIDGATLTSYAMTEIMSISNDAETDAKILDVLLKNGAIDMLTRVPALHDAQPSFGLYQHTPYAVNIREVKTKEGKPQTEYVGASKMNRALAAERQLPREMQTPSGYAKFTDFHDQNTFAVLFALHNLAETVDTLYRLDPTLVAELKHISHETLMEYIATSHHRPHPSTDAVIGMLRHLKKGKHTTYASECAPALKLYAKRTLDHHESLQKYV